MSIVVFYPWWVSLVILAALGVLALIVNVVVPALQRRRVRRRGENYLASIERNRP